MPAATVAKLCGGGGFWRIPVRRGRIKKMAFKKIGRIFALLCFSGDTEEFNSYNSPKISHQPKKKKL